MISIIIPIYNTEKYLEECLQSIISQTYQKFEVICVNDASTDNSLKILEKYAQSDSRIKIINHKKNKGVATARNTGIKNTKSEYITFIDSDDKVAPTYLETLVKYRDKADCVEISHQLYFQDDMNKDKIKYDKLWYEKFIHKKPTNIYEVNSKYIKQLHNSCWCKLYKKSIIDKYKISCPKNLLQEDNEFISKYIFQCKNIYYVDECLYFYRRHKKSLMSDNILHYQHIDDIVKVYINLVKYLKKYNLFEKNLNVIRHLAFKYVQPQMHKIIFLKPKSIKKIYKLGKLLNVPKSTISKYILKIQNKYKFNTNIYIEDITKENTFEIVETKSKIEKIENENSNQISFNTKSKVIDIKIKNSKDGRINIYINLNVHLDEHNIIKNKKTIIKRFKINDAELSSKYTLTKDKNFSLKDMLVLDNEILHIYLELE